MTTIAFQMSCYENSYQLVLLEGLLSKNLNQFPNINFAEKFLIINNVINKELVEENLRLYPDIRYFNAYDEIVNVLPKFNLSAFDFPPSGIYYSLQHFIGNYYTKCDYLFHVSEDCLISDLDSQFVLDCIDILESNDNYISAQPRWGDNVDLGAKEEALGRDGKFYICRGYSDQINIYKTKVFKQDIYHFEHPDSNRFPPKGGNSFERRVNSYLMQNNKFRAVHMDYYYLHGYYDNIIKGA